MAPTDGSAFVPRISPAIPPSVAWSSTFATSPTASGQRSALSHSGFHDSLTGLPNRALFHDRLEHALDRTARSGLGVAVVYLDLDGFKMVNDSRGHEAGDQVLREVAARVTRAVRTLDTVSRLGGDEFAILIEESARVLDEAETVAERVLQSLTEPFMVDVQQIVLSASIGIAIGDVSCTASSMMRDADVAMYKAKTTGKSQWAVYEPAMRTAALDRLELESDLHQAVDGHQLRLIYQPIIELRSDKIVGFEALLRWDHPTRGVIEPDRFIPIAESSGTIVADRSLGAPRSVPHRGRMEALVPGHEADDVSQPVGSPDWLHPTSSATSPTPWCDPDSPQRR